MTHTIDSLITELTRLAASRGMGGSTKTNVIDMTESPGLGYVELRFKDSVSIDDLKTQVQDLKEDVAGLQRDNRDLGYQVDDLERDLREARS